MDLLSVMFLFTCYIYVLLSMWRFYKQSRPGSIANVNDKQRALENIFFWSSDVFSPVHVRGIYIAESNLTHVCTIHAGTWESLLYTFFFVLKLRMDQSYTFIKRFWSKALLQYLYTHQRGHIFKYNYSHRSEIAIFRNGSRLDCSPKWSEKPLSKNAENHLGNI